MTRDQFINFQLKFYNTAHKLMMAKNADYSTGEDGDAPAFANFDIVEHYPALGVYSHNGVFVRLLDKISRLSRVMQEENSSKVSDESVMDTCLDIANYSSIIAAIVLVRKGKDHIE